MQDAETVACPFTLVAQVACAPQRPKITAALVFRRFRNNVEIAALGRRDREGDREEGRGGGAASPNAQRPARSRPLSSPPVVWSPQHPGNLARASVRLAVTTVWDHAFPLPVPPLALAKARLTLRHAGARGLVAAAGERQFYGSTDTGARFPRVVVAHTHRRALLFVALPRPGAMEGGQPRGRAAPPHLSSCGGGCAAVRLC